MCTGTGTGTGTGIDGEVNLTQAIRRATSELLHGPLPERRLRSNPRAVRRKMSSYGVKRAAHRPWPNQPTQHIGIEVRVLNPP